jgi:hypothetical protein
MPGMNTNSFPFDGRDASSQTWWWLHCGSLQFGLTGGFQSMAGSVSCGAMVRGASGVGPASLIAADSSGVEGRAGSLQATRNKAVTAVIAALEGENMQPPNKKRELSVADELLDGIETADCSNGRSC